MAPNPTSIIAQVCGSGTADVGDGIGLALDSCLVRFVAVSSLAVRPPGDRWLIRSWRVGPASVTAWGGAALCMLGAACNASCPRLKLVTLATPTAAPKTKVVAEMIVVRLP